MERDITIDVKLSVLVTLTVEDGQALDGDKLRQAALENAIHRLKVGQETNTDDTNLIESIEFLGTR